MKRFFFLTILLVFPFFLPPLAQAGGCDNPNSICSLQPLPNGAKPGSACNGVPNYVYGSSTACFFGQSPCIPHCGLGDAWCCDPKPGYNPKNIPGESKAAPPPCATSQKNGNCTSVDTGIGTFSTDPAGFIRSIFGVLLSLSGGIALLLIIASGYQLMTSQGNPEKVKEARERLTSAVVGLIFIIFSVTILQIIGVTILRIPGFK